MTETSRLRITGVTGGPLRITGATLVNGAYELATAGGADYELQTERQTMLSEILFIPGLNGSGTRQVALPAEFDAWDMGVTITRSGPRTFSVDKTIDDFMPITTTTYYVDGATGNDANDGLTALNAKATITNAWANATGTPRILIAPGQYTLTRQERNAVLEGNGGNWSLSSDQELGGTTRVTVGFKNWTANFRLQVGGLTTCVFDAPHFETGGSSSAAIRGIGDSKFYVFNATGTACVRDAMSYNGNCQGLEVDCVIDDIGTTDSDNISTGHDSARIVSVGGSYTNAARPVADINSSKRLLFGKTLNTSYNPPGDTQTNVRVSSSDGAGTCQIWCYGVDARGGATYDLFAADGGQIFYDAETLFDTSDGDVTAFTPTYTTPTSPTFEGILDDYETGLEVAWSTGRQLRTGWSGAVVRLRRSSDNAESDFNGSGSDGSVDLDAIESWAGVGDAYFVKVYDQSGNGRDWEQSNTALQPLAVSSGVAVNFNNRLASGYNGSTSNRRMTVASSTGLFKFLHDGTTSTVYSIQEVANDGNSKTLFSTYSGTSDTGARVTFSSTETCQLIVRGGSGVVPINVTKSTGFASNFAMVQLDADNATAANREEVWKDGIVLTADNAQTAAPSTANATLDFNIGTTGPALTTNPFSGKVCEMVMWSQDLTGSRAAMEASSRSFWRTP